MSSDAIAKIEILENLKMDNQVKISFFDGVDLIQVCIFDNSNRSIRLDKFY